MIGADVSLPIAFGAGFLSFFSPCLLPMIPAYIMYITGVDMEDDLSKVRMTALMRTLGFVLGFTVIFMIMGSSASFLGRAFIQNKTIFLVGPLALDRYWLPYWYLQEHPPQSQREFYSCSSIL